MNLIKKLTSETKELKKAYLTKIENWAKNEFKQLNELSKLDQYGLGETLGIEYYTKTCRFTGLKVRSFSKINGVSFYNHKVSLKLDRLQNKIRKCINLGETGYIKKEIEAGKKHYNNSIEKLAARIEKKGLNKKSLKLKTSFLDPNINTQITDGKKTVNAYTIIASGPVQKPHYRYLVK